jgi:hypothetical protein
MVGRVPMMVLTRKEMADLLAVPKLDDYSAGVINRLVLDRLYAKSSTVSVVDTGSPSLSAENESDRIWRAWIRQQKQGR